MTLTVTFWFDREPEIAAGPLPAWLASAVLNRASELMADMAEADLVPIDDEEEEDD